jgi:hypothetical protein
MADFKNDGSENPEYVCDCCGKVGSTKLDRYFIKRMSGQLNPGYDEYNICPDCFNIFRNMKDVISNDLTVTSYGEKKVAPFNEVSHPSHYVYGRKYEPKDVIRDWNLNFNLGNVVKYISRAGRKEDELVDLEKARQYLEFEIAALEEENGIGD